MVEDSPNILASEEKATTTDLCHTFLASTTGPSAVEYQLYSWLHRSLLQLPFRLGAPTERSGQVSPSTDWVVGETRGTSQQMSGLTPGFHTQSQQRPSSSLFYGRAIVSSSDTGRDVHPLH